MNAGRWFPAAPPERLAVLRVIVGGFAVAYLVLSAPAFWSLADAEPGRFDPVGVLVPLGGPLSPALFIGIYVAAVAAGLAFTLGAWFRAIGPLFAALLLTLCTYRSSWGQILWLENLMVLHVAVVGCSPAADVLAWPARRPPGSMDRSPSERYGIPVRLAALVTLATYVVAGVAKLRLGGVAWATSDSLRNHIAATAVRSQFLDAPFSPLARWLVGHGWLFPPMAVASLVLELAAPLALVGRRMRNGWVLVTWLMHVAIAASMFVVFPYPLFVVAFAPLFDLEQVVAAWRRRRAPGPPVPPVKSYGLPAWDNSGPDSSSLA